MGGGSISLTWHYYKRRPKPSNILKIKNKKVKMAEQEMLFKEISLPEQQSRHGTSFPTILTPNNNNNSQITLSSFKDAIKSQKKWLESILHKSGAILFRGFPLSSPAEFNDVIEAFGFPELLYAGGIAARTQVVGRVYTANEAPPDHTIPFHHEMAYVSEFPSKLFFFCEEEPGCGGETPIVLSHIIYDRMKEIHPEFVAQLEEHGVIYTLIMAEKDDPSSPVGRSWQSMYSTNDKKVAEERAAKQGSRLEWMDKCVKVIMGPTPGIRFDETRQNKIWFNQLSVAYRFPDKAQSDINAIKPVTLGNEKPLPAHAMRDLAKILNEECVAIPWKKGDVMLLDNMAVLHSRRALIKPPRRVLASLCK